MSESRWIFRFKIKKWNPLFVFVIEALNYSVRVHGGEETLLAETNPGEVAGDADWALAVVQSGEGVGIDNLAIHLLVIIKRHTRVINNDKQVLIAGHCHDLGSLLEDILLLSLQ